MIKSSSVGLLEERKGAVTRFFVTVLAALLIASMFAPSVSRPAQADVGGGRVIEVFYERNIVALDRYPANTQVRIDVIRNVPTADGLGTEEKVVGSVTGTTDASGFLEINHLGDNDCWGPNALDPNAPNVTPDIKPKDRVQATFQDAGTGAQVTDFTVVRDVFVDLGAIAFDDVNGTITVKGHAKATADTPLAAEDVLELRLNKANRANPWGDNGDPASRRDLRADIAADLQPDGTFTHVFSGLAPEDVVDTRENGVDQALVWLKGPIVDEAAGASEATFFDESEGVPPGCPPLEGASTAPDAFGDVVPNVHKSQQVSAEGLEGVDSPRSIEVFHGIEFVGLVNYPARADVRVEVLRDGVEIGSTTQKTDASGLLEINHIGGGLFPAGDCWDPGATPDIRPEDRVLSTILSSGEQDSTVVRDIMIYDAQTSVDTANNTITINGHARSTADAPMSFGGVTPDVLEVRLNASGFTWEAAGGRKDLRADVGANVSGIDGTFTQVFQVSDLDADRAAANGFEQMIEWSPAVAEPNSPPELTVYDGTEGALPGCPPLLKDDAITSSSHPFINAANQAQDLVLSGVSAGNADSISVSIQQNGQQIAAQAAQAAANGKTWTATFAAGQLAGLQEGRFDAEATFVRSAGVDVPEFVTWGTAAMMKDTAAPADPTATPAPGEYRVSQQVELSSEAGARIYYDTDGDPLTEPSTLYSGPIAVNKTQTIEAVAVDKAGNKSNVASFAYAINAADTQLSLSATPQVFTHGDPNNVVLSGSLSSGVEGVAGQQVVLEKRPAGATGWGHVATQTTGTGGNYSFSVAKSSIDRNTDFRVRFAGADGYKASEAIQSVRVKVRVTLNLSTTSLQLGREVTLSGSVSPAHSGSVSLTITRSTGQVVTQNATLRNSSYSLKYKPPARGDYTVVARYAGDADHEGGESPSRTFRVN